MDSYTQARCLIARFVVLIMMAVNASAISAQTMSRPSNLPSVYIETYSGKGINSKHTYEMCRLWIVDENDSISLYDSTEVRGRGNSTWSLAKKPYRIKFAEKQKLLGKGYAKARKWVLMANCGDKTLMRNAITSIMGEMLGLPFNPGHLFVDLTLNGSFRGNYMLTDQVDVRPHRVDVVEQDLPLTSESNITGGYLLEVDGFKDGNCFTTSQYGVPIRIHYPDEEDIADSQNQYVRQYMADFENTLHSAHFDDPVRGYRPMVDSVTLANWYIATELSANIDGFYSTYFYKNQDAPRLYWGPLWDYDIAYGNDSRMGDTRYTMMYQNGYGATKNWIQRMWQDPWFARLINRRYRQVLEEGLVERMQHTIDSIAAHLDISQQANYKKWGISTRMYHECVLYSTYDQYVRDLKDFITDHSRWLYDEFGRMMPADGTVQETPDDDSELTPDDEPTPPAPYGFAPQRVWYRLTNAGNGKAMDVNTESGLIQLWSSSDTIQSQQWEIRQTAHGLMLTNRLSGMALTDPTQGEATATTNVGTQLTTELPDSTRTAQLWRMELQEARGAYNLINLRTGHTANLSGGNTADGTKILSYTTDERNATSNNRLWLLTEGDSIASDADIDPELPTDSIAHEPDAEDAVLAPEELEYALAYDPVSHQLHFAGNQPQRLTFAVSVLDMSGRVVGTFRADERFSMATEPPGVYVITWMEGHRRRSAKLAKH